MYSIVYINNTIYVNNTLYSKNTTNSFDTIIKKLIGEARPQLK